MNLQSSLTDVEKLEKENRELKQRIGALQGGRQALTSIRAIQLRHENKCMQDILAELKRQRTDV